MEVVFLEQFNRVRLCTDRFILEGAKFGDLGYIIECYSDGCFEVEFSDPTTGVSFAQIVVEKRDIELAE
jgi:hypothetical protein